MYALYCAAYYTTHHANTGLDISTGIDDTLDGITGATNGNSTIDTTTSLSIPNEFANVSISSHGIGETHDGSNNGTTFEIETSTETVHGKLLQMYHYTIGQWSMHAHTVWILLQHSCTLHERVCMCMHVCTLLVPH
jgi:hypothetical protein